MPFAAVLLTKSLHSFVLHGLESDRKYKLHFQDATAPDAMATGRQLMNGGLKIRLVKPLSSELVFIEEAESTGK